jgi:hypothetical protein
VAAGFGSGAAGGLCAGRLVTDWVLEPGSCGTINTPSPRPNMRPLISSIKLATMYFCLPPRSNRLMNIMLSHDAVMCRGMMFGEVIAAVGVARSPMRRNGFKHSETLLLCGFDVFPKRVWRLDLIPPNADSECHA